MKEPMTHLTELLGFLRAIAKSLNTIETLMRERLPMPLPADACAGCGLALDHIGPSKYCVKCDSARAHAIHQQQESGWARGFVVDHQNERPDPNLDRQEERINAAAGHTTGEHERRVPRHVEISKNRIICQDDPGDHADILAKRARELPGGP